MDSPTINMSDSYAMTAISNEKYEQADLSSVFGEKTYLNSATQWDTWHATWQKQIVFRKFKPDAKPFQLKLYLVPHVHLSTFKKELDCLVKLLCFKAGAYLRAPGTFPVPEKNWLFVGSAISANWSIRLDIYNILSQRLKTFFIQPQCPYQVFNNDSCLHSILYHPSYVLLSLRLANINTQAYPWMFANQLILRKQQQKKSPEEFPAWQSTLTHTTWDEHFNCLKQVLLCLHENSFSVNPTNWNWCVWETDLLGFWFTPTGTK
jgi:hypothetical protein